MFNKILSLLVAQRRARWGLFLSAAVIQILLNGYHFGTFDQFAHIPFLKKMVNPGLYQGDPFLSMSYGSFSYFWQFFALIYRLDIFFQNDRPFILGTVMFIVHLATTVLFYTMLWELSIELFHRPSAALLAVLGFLLPRFGFGGFPVLEFSLLNRTVVLPFLLLAILLYLRGRRLPAFLLVGIIFNFHLLSGNFVISMFTLDSLLRLRSVGWRSFLIEWAAFMLCASPILYWKFNSLTGSSLTYPAWFDLITSGMLPHLFLMFNSTLYIIVGNLIGLSSLLFYWIAAGNLPDHPHRSILRNFVISLMLMIGVEIFTAYGLHITLILQLQIIRAGVFITIFAILYWMAYVLQVYEAQPADPLARFWLPLTSLFSPLPLLAMAVEGLRQYVASVRLQLAAIIVMLIAGLAGAVWFADRYQILAPGIFPYGRSDAWMDVQLWAKHNTPTSALFITPPEKWWLYDTHWRVFSERGTIVTLSDLLMVALVPDYTPTWIERFDAVAPGVRQQFNGNYFDNAARTHAAFYSLTEQDLLAIGETYGADYIVLEKPASRSFPVLYENSEYIVYTLSPAPSPHSPCHCRKCPGVFRAALHILCT